MKSTKKKSARPRVDRGAVPPISQGAVPPKSQGAAPPPARSFNVLLQTVHALRRKCPWDKKQTAQSLKPYLIEETYELIEALDEGDPAKIKEELGDLLFQIFFHAEIACEKRQLDMAGVLEAVDKKMRARHPHVFGRADIAGATCPDIVGARSPTEEEVIAHWEEAKRAEGKLRGSILEGVPGGLPALLMAERLQKRAAKVGFDWRNIGDILEKLDEETVELKSEIKSRKRRRTEEELGDMLFTLANISRRLGIDPEEALRKTNRKFIARFRHMEKSAARKGKDLREMTLDEMDGLWEKAKRRLGV